MNRTDYLFADRNGLPLSLTVFHQHDHAAQPTIVCIHGGGWREGTRLDDLALIEFLTSHGYCVVSIDYRLSGVASFPAQYDDVQDALAWIRHHPENIPGDVSRIGLIGISAGGQLAALTAAHLAGTPDAIQCVCSVCTRYELTIDWYAVEGRSMPPEVAESLSAYLGDLPWQVPDVATAASAYWHLTREMSPNLVIHGTADETVPPAQARAWVAMLRHLGIACNDAWLPGVGHDVPTFLWSEEGRETQTELIAFFDRYLGEK